MNKIENKDRLIYALDVPNFETAKQTIDNLGDSISFYKIGLELNASRDYFKLIDYLKSNNKKIFADLKFHDIPNTVKQATKNIASEGVDFLTVHGEPPVVKAAVEGAKDKTKILAVTILTSVSQSDIEELGIPYKIQELAIKKANQVKLMGAYGVICSGHEVKKIKNHVKGLKAICPGIRPFDMNDDQHRTVNVEQAFSNGADYIVVGRPISKADNPKVAAEEIQSQIAQIFA